MQRHGVYRCRAGSLETAPTPLHRQTSRQVRIIATMALVLCTTLVMTQGLRTGDWLARQCRHGYRGCHGSLGQRV